MPDTRPGLDALMLAQAIVNIEYPDESRIALAGEEERAALIAAEYDRLASPATGDNRPDPLNEYVGITNYPTPGDNDRPGPDYIDKERHDRIARLVGDSRQSEGLDVASIVRETLDIAHAHPLMPGTEVIAKVRGRLAAAAPEEEPR